MGGGEEVEVSVDFGSAPDPGSPSAVAAAHQVTEFAFDLRPGGPVVGGPVGILLLTAGIGETLLVTADPDGAPVLGVGAVCSEHTPGAGVCEQSGPVTVTAPSNSHRHLVGARDGVSVEIDLETVLGEPATGSDRRLGRTLK